MQLAHVDDPDDERLADYRHLHPQRRKVDAAGARQGRVIVEGAFAVCRLLQSPLKVRSVLVTPNKLLALEGVLSVSGVPVLVADRELVEGIAGFDVHRGVLAAADRPPAVTPIDAIAGAATVAVLEGVSDHENVGALFRSAAALGVGAVLLSPGTADPLYRRSIRVSLGHVLHLPFALVEPWPQGLGDLRRAGFTVAALTPDGEDDVDDVEIEGRVAVVLGAEGSGLSFEAMELVDRRVRIPMRAGADSLNVAAAGAIAFHRLARV